MKAAEYGKKTNAVSAFVSTNSICQGQQVPILWPLIFATGHEISFAHTSFKWANLASHNAGVTVAIIGMSNRSSKNRRLFTTSDLNETTEKTVETINAYLVSGSHIIINKASKPLTCVSEMEFGNKASDGGHLLLTKSEVEELELTKEEERKFVYRIFGSAEFIQGKLEYCLWINDKDALEANAIFSISQRIEGVRKMRMASSKAATKKKLILHINLTR